MERKKMIETIGMLFVAAMFLSSYAAFGTGGAGSGATTTVNGSYAYAQTPNPVKAQMLGFNSTMQASVTCSNAAQVSDMLAGLLNNMSKNGNVTDFVPENSTITLIEAGQEGSYALYTILGSALGPGANCTSFTTTEELQLPSTLNVVIAGLSGTSTVEVPSSLRNEYLPATFKGVPSNSISVYVYMEITRNYTASSVTLKPESGA